MVCLISRCGQTWFGRPRKVVAIRSKHMCFGMPMNPARERCLLYAFDRFRYKSIYEKQLHSYCTWLIFCSSQYNFGGNLDLMRFLREVHSAGLYAILRIGPYACAEWNYGYAKLLAECFISSRSVDPCINLVWIFSAFFFRGFPVWLHQIPGIEMRTDNQFFKVYIILYTCYSWTSQLLGWGDALYRYVIRCLIWSTGWDAELHYSHCEYGQERESLCTTRRTNYPHSGIQMNIFILNKLNILEGFLSVAGGYIHCWDDLQLTMFFINRLRTNMVM